MKSNYLNYIRTANGAMLALPVYQRKKKHSATVNTKKTMQQKTSRSVSTSPNRKEN